jgi:hypothetical protein
MNRNDNIDILGDPWKALSDEQKAHASELSKSDKELEADLKFAKSLSAMSASDLVGEPPVSDAVFLVNLRQKLDRSRSTQFFGSLSSFRLRISALVACAFLVAGIFWGGGQGVSPVTANRSDLAASDLIWYQDYDDLEGIDDVAVAEVLDMSEDSVLWDFESDSSEPITDQLLELTPEDMDEILEQFAATSFFANQGTVDEG